MQTLSQNVPSGIEIAVMACTTSACPHTISKRQHVILLATNATQATRWEEAFDDNQVFVLPICFVGEKLPECRPSSIKYARRQLGFRKPTNGQVFNRDQVVFPNQLSAVFV